MESFRLASVLLSVAIEDRWICVPGKCSVVLVPEVHSKCSVVPVPEVHILRTSALRRDYGRMLRNIT